MESQRIPKEFPKPELVPVVDDQTVADIGEMALRRGPIDATPGLNPVEARSERIVLYLLDQPGFAIYGNAVGNLRETLDITVNEWSKTRTTLVQRDRVMLARDEIDAGSSTINKLNPDSIVELYPPKPFITLQVLEKCKTNIGLLDLDEEKQAELVKKLDVAIEKRKYKDEIISIDAQALSSSQRKQQKEELRKEAKKILANSDPQQQVEKDTANRSVTFKFDIADRYFTTSYTSAEYGKLYPINKLLLAVGISSAFTQTKEAQREYLKRMVNKHAKEESHYNNSKLTKLIKEGLQLEFIVEEDDMLTLTEASYDFLSILRYRQGAHFGTLD